ncbi:fumarylacetoacetate hydrolase family protein [Rhodopirellula sp. JC639]|uniref:fumarylacetoacetate hydrolase family protein n=1 Tax=Stieleria mannarensis TaxID=2755585 RepID=UPI0016000544|nr:fumarylacetoacetate hydrolase family protein [Rhodopirellula sp. JC639]
MPICRIPGPDGRPEYAYYQNNQVCPLRLVMDAAPSEAELFGLRSDDVPNPDSIAAEHWSPAPEALLPPVPTPEKVICIGLNYRDHAIETNSPIPSEPVVFNKFSTSVIGHGQAIQLPSISQKVDYEAELVVVIGREGRDIPVVDAMQHVYGYTCGHDVSARDWQKGRPGGQWLLGKTFDTFAPLGPCVVTTDELPDPSNVRVQMELNGEIVQDSTTAQLIFDIPTTIAHLSKFVTLKPGDVIFTGTPPGVGDAKDPPVYLRPGDRCSVIVDGIGTLTNTCQ